MLSILWFSVRSLFGLSSLSTLFKMNGYTLVIQYWHTHDPVSGLLSRSLCNYETSTSSFWFNHKYQMITTPVQRHQAIHYLYINFATHERCILWLYSYKQNFILIFNTHILGSEIFRETIVWKFRNKKCECWRSVLNFVYMSSTNTYKSIHSRTIFLLRLVIYDVVELRRFRKKKKVPNNSG